MIHSDLFKYKMMEGKKAKVYICGGQGFLSKG